MHKIKMCSNVTPISLTSRFLFGLLAVISSLKANKIISSPRITDWGTWGEWDRCPKGTYATAFQLQVEKPQGGGVKYDDTALNSIKLFCNTPGELWRNNSITSKTSEFGDWGDIFDCDSGVINGFQLRSEEDQKSDDDTAANNLRVFCVGTNENTKKVGLNGTGLTWGKETDVQRCSDRQAVCAIKTQVEAPLGSAGDDTALNNLDMECCDIPSPATNCKAVDEFELVVLCDNRQGTEHINCDYEKYIGVSSPNKTQSPAFEIIMSTGFTISEDIEVLSSKFRSDLKDSEITGHSWKLESPLSFAPLKSKVSSFTVAPAEISELYQVVGYCDYYKVYSTTFKMMEYSPNDRYVSPTEVALTLL